jgi:hypothetical protein
MRQYLRVDSGCQTNNPTQWLTWVTHYYGLSCNAKIYQTRCNKPTNSCNGTLISSTSFGTAIQCN